MCCPSLSSACRLLVSLFVLLMLQMSVRDVVADDSTEATTKVLRAGAAMSNITPPLGEKIVGGWKPTPAKHIHDELHARCLVLNDGSTTLAFVICDNVGIPREVFDAARELIIDETDIPATNILFSATHTHSATTARGENKAVKLTEFTAYQQYVIRRAADVVRIALNNLEPARIGWGSVGVPEEVFNRRWFMTGDEKALRNPFGGVDQVRMNPPSGSPQLLRPAGPTDPEVSFLSVQAADGRPLALLANYSLHYVGGVPGAEVSADYFAIFAHRIGQLLNAPEHTPAFVGIMTNGTSGNINNIDFQNRRPRRQPYEKMTEVAELVAQRVAKAHANIEHQSWVPLSAKMTELTLAFRKPSPEMLSWMERTLAQPEDEVTWHRHERTYAKRVQAFANSPGEVSIPLQTFGIGELGIAAIPFEVFVETGLQLKEESPFKQTFTVSLANGSYGYLPTPEHHELGGYETWLGTNYVEPQASVMITDRLLEMFDELQDR